jgi:predicted Zn-dependent peptidase
MISIAKQELYYGKYFFPEEVISAVESVTLEDVKALSRLLIEDTPLALTVYGPVNEKDLPLQNLRLSN